MLQSLPLPQYLPILLSLPVTPDDLNVPLHHLPHPLLHLPLPLLLGQLSPFFTREGEKKQKQKSREEKRNYKDFRLNSLRPFKTGKKFRLEFIVVWYN